MENEFKILFESFIATLNGNNVRYSILRGYENLPNCFSNDLDFGIHPKDKMLFFFSLRKFKRKYCNAIILRDTRLEVLKITIKKDDLCVDFDFWFGFNYLGLEYMDIELMIENNTKFNNFNILTAENEFTLSFLKELLHNSRIRTDKIDNLTRMLAICDQNKIATYFNKYLRNRFLNEIMARRMKLRKLSFYSKVYLLFYNIVNKSVYKLIRDIVHFIIYHQFPIFNPLEKYCLNI
jgi:hypothetical protein